MNPENLVPVLLVGLLVAFSGCVHSSGVADQPSDQGPAPDDAGGDEGPGSAEADVVINYTSDGFSPERVTVDKGDTVKWVARSGSMWVASNDHPTHREYGTEGGEPVFDQQGAGKVYYFAFNRTGTWEYHNHRAPYHQGVVVVE
ncbi:MAG: hypothetical protein ABEK01_02645 [Candidatus Nanohaloarchaea archaeon]